MTNLPRCITGGVDTHLDVHVAAALDDRGALLGVESFATTEGGYKKLLAWLSRLRPGRARRRRRDRVLWGRTHSPSPSRAGPRRRSRPSQPPAPPAQGQVRPPRRHLGRPGRPLGRCRWRGQDEGRKRRIHAGFARRSVLGAQGADPGAQPDAQPGLDRTRAHPSRAPGPQRLPPPRAGLDLSTRHQARRHLADQVHASDAGPPGHHPRRGDLRDRRHPQTLGQRDRARARRHVWASGPTPRRRSSSPPATIPNDCATRRPSPISAAPHRSTPAAARTNDTGSTAAVIVRPTRPCGTS